MNTDNENQTSNSTVAGEIPAENTWTKMNAIFPVWLHDVKMQSVVLILIAFLFYGNTISNEFAFDDNIVILRNEYVYQGMQGIPGILTKDSYDSYFRQNSSDNVLAGGRYRPLSIITFAIEQQLLGASTPEEAKNLSGMAPSFNMNQPHEQVLLRNMHVRHAVNVLLFALSLIVLLHFLRLIVFPKSPFMAFAAALIFAIHPIHTEVVANVKSRDEILSLLFICLAFIFAFKYQRGNIKKHLWYALLCYFLALLSKEYGVTVLALLPLSLYLFNNDTPKKSILAILPFLAVTGLYMAIRASASPIFSNTVDETISNNAYAYATNTQKVATKIATSLNYLKLLLFPHPLSSDYSYNSIPYKDFSHPLVWLSALTHLLLPAGFFYFFKKHRIISFAIAFYALHLLLINNFIFYIGATMGERLIYHSSVGFAIAVAYFLCIGLAKIALPETRKLVLSGLAITAIILCGFKTIQRNSEWKNNFTLAAHDVKVVPYSFLMNANVGISYLNLSYTKPSEQSSNVELVKALGYFSRAISVNDRSAQLHTYRGEVYFRLKKIDSALLDLNKVREINPDYPNVPELYYNVGVAYYKLAEYQKALGAWQQALAIKPDYASPQKAINILYSANLLPKQ